MAGHFNSHRTSLHALLVAGALCALGATGAVAQSSELSNLFGNQAEWAQGYDADARFAVQRSTTPVLSQATLDATQRALEQYRQIVQRGGWQKVPTGRTLKLGSTGPAVIALRKRLIVSGDLDSSSGLSSVFDSYLEAAVKHFEARHGLIENGVVGPEAIADMNVPADMRLHQLEINITRLNSMSHDLGSRYVMANIPAESVETVENGVVATHHRAGVGRIDRQSPVMRTNAYDINFNPFWNVPPSLIKKDLIPKMLKDANYLTEHHIRVYNSDNQEVSPSSINWHTDQATHFRYKEDPGTENSLGVVRINIANPYGVYMHDTPEKGVFGDDNRFVSSGCIRVQNVRDYVQWLLKDTPGWGRPQIDEAIRSGQQINVKLNPAVPVYWVYITAWATPNGLVQFRDDIYQRDGFNSNITASIAKPVSGRSGDDVSNASYDQGGLDAAPDER